MTKLRGYQTALKAGIYDAWQRGARNVVGVTATGSGKTVTMASMAAELGGIGRVQAHRAELVGQLSLALGQEGVRHNIVAAKPTVKAIAAAHMEEFGRVYYDPRANWSVASVQTLVKRQDPDAHRVQYVFTDECFPAGTLIDGVPIEQIAAGDTVRAFDEQTGQIVPGRVVRTMRSSAPSHMVRVSVSHHVLECTNGHPFFTQRGWVAAANLDTSDHVFISDLHPMQDPVSIGERVAAIPLPKNRAGILQPSVRVCAPHCDDETPRAARVAGDAMPYVPEHCGLDGAPTGPMGSDGASVLQPRMLGCVPGNGVQRGNGENEPQTRIETDGRKQPDAQRSHAGESQRIAAGNGAPSDCAGREWQACNTGRDCVGKAAGADGLCSASGCADRDGPEFGMAQPLQAGQRPPRTENSGGSGRGEPHDTGATDCGRPQGCVPAWQRVDSVSIFKWADSDHAGRSDGGRFIYNFEVERYHTYVAGGVVVHNCHHVLADNIWGKAMQLYPNARGLLMTATPTRADGKGLGRHHDGLADAMVLGPGLREQIENGFLTGYKVAAPTAADLDMSDVHITAGGDYNQQEAARAVKRSRKIVGDAVDNYQSLASGKLAIVFAADIEHGNTLADAFNAAGVPAAMVTGDTDEADRRAIMKRFKARELLVLVNVDLFGEGVDVPAVEVVIMCRPTASFALYTQCIGRMLRLNISPILMAAWDTFTAAQRLQHIAESAKPHGILIDHVGNVYREFNVGGHKYSGLPEGFDKWTLDRRQRRASSGGDAIPVRMCGECFKPYERCFDACPYCGAVAPEPAVRGGPQQVDGDLRFLDDVTLARLRGAITVIDGPAKIPQNVPAHVQAAAIRAHHERQAQQANLRAAMAQWAGWHHLDSLATNYKRFYYRFGVDVLSAMALGAGDAAALTERINSDMKGYL